MQILSYRFVESKRTRVNKVDGAKIEAMKLQGYLEGAKMGGQILMVKPSKGMVYIKDEFDNEFYYDMRNPIRRYYDYKNLTKQRFERFIKDYIYGEIQILYNQFGDIVIVPSD